MKPASGAILAALATVAVVGGCDPAPNAAPETTSKPFFELSAEAKAARYADFISRAEFDAAIENPRAPEVIWADVVAVRKRIRELQVPVEEIWKPEVEEIWRKLSRAQQLLGELLVRFGRDPQLEGEIVLLNTARGAIAGAAEPASHYNISGLYRFLPDMDVALISLQQRLKERLPETELPAIDPYVSPKVLDQHRAFLARQERLRPRTE